MNAWTTLVGIPALMITGIANAASIDPVIDSFKLTDLLEEEIGETTTVSVIESYGFHTHHAVAKHCGCNVDLFLYGTNIFVSLERWGSVRLQPVWKRKVLGALAELDLMKNGYSDYTHEVRRSAPLLCLLLRLSGS